MESAEVLVVTAQRALALEDLDFHAWLAVGVGRKHIGLLGRDRRVTRDHGSGDAASGFDREGEGSHIQQEHILHVAFEHAALNSCANSHNFVRIYTLVGLFADEFPSCLNDLWHTSHAAYEHQFIHIILIPLRVRETVFYRLECALEEVIGELLELRAGELFLNVLWPTGVRSDEWQVDLVFLRGRERSWLSRPLP